MPSKQPEVAAPIEALWTIQQAGAYLGMPIGTLYAWRTKGIGPAAYKVGRHLRYDPAEIRRWLAQGCS